MKQEELKALLGDMSRKEKIGQLFQISGYLFADDSVSTGPMQEMGVTREDLDLAGTVLGVTGAERIKKIQTEYMEKHPHHIPLIFMMDVINGYRTVIRSLWRRERPLTRNCRENVRKWQPERELRQGFMSPFLL